MKSRTQFQLAGDGESISAFYTTRIPPDTETAVCHIADPFQDGDGNGMPSYAIIYSSCF